MERYSSVPKNAITATIPPVTARVLKAPTIIFPFNVAKKDFIILSPINKLINSYKLFL